MGHVSSLVAGAAMLGVACGAISTAQADFAFSGTGVNANFTGQASEPYTYNFIVTPQQNWGSPGVGHGVTPYLEASPAFGFDITFTGGGVIDPASVLIGNAAACVGS